MDFSFLSFLHQGFLDASFGTMVLYTLVMTHITIVSVTLYLHRYSAHRALELHPVLKHFFRFWLWLTTGMLTKEWTAVHRKHHVHCETEEDPHSPQIFGLKKVLWEGAELYGVTAAKADVLERFGKGTPGRLDRAQPLQQIQDQRRRRDDGDRPRAVRRRGSDDLGDPDDLDSVLRGRRRQRRRSLLGLSQLRMSRCRAQPRAVGHPDRRRRAAQQPPHLSELGEVLGRSRGSSIWVGCGSICSGCSVSRVR